MSDERQQSVEESKCSSCDSGYSRKEFIKTALKGIAIGAGAAAIPKVMDKFLVPPAYANTSTSQVGTINHMVGGKLYS